MPPSFNQKRDWNIIYRWVVILIFIFQIIGTGVGMYAAKAYVKSVAAEEMKAVVGPIAEAVANNTKAVRDFQSFKDAGPRVTPDTLTILRSEAVAEAVAQSRLGTDELRRDMKELSTQIVELKLILARQSPR